ncbi:hypothetical protein VHEMI06072 [[Torrubiella] hemipterigena]|uniref:2EXR domain-containing protein n=1 Tax=[Torrubiella] hemipterigena TaxID=1531966 RepID=A0A0A1TIK7_9HYPO|nr:hypothetical protein VHEMI06072 [[Torrubiella] hemipterigena]
MDFPQFSNLPIEIRLQIWGLCLPRRLVATDKLETHYLRTKQPCQAWRTPIQPNARPIIKGVCKEAWQVVEDGGAAEGYTEDYDANSNVWVQPKLDKVQLFWTRYYTRMDDHRSDYPHAMFGFEASELNMPISVMGEPFCTFPAGDTTNSSFPWPTVETSRHVCSGNAAAAYLMAFLDPPQDVEMVLEIVGFHILDRKAAESGLFGLLGDAPVHGVAYNDTQRIRKFQALFEVTRLPDALDDAAAAEIEYFMSPAFASDVALWKQLVEWVLMVQLWLHDALDGTLDPRTAGTVWKPVIVVDFGARPTISMERYSFDPSHPWVREAAKQVFRVRPTVVFRHCRVNCRQYASQER